MSVQRRLRRDLAAAMKARDPVAVPALRSVLAALANAEAVDASAAPEPAGSEHFAGAAAGLGAAETPRRELTDADVAAIVEAEIAERVSAAEHARRSGHARRADQLSAEAQALARYLTN